MSLDLGELVGTLRMDVTPFDQALSHGEQALNSFAGTGKAAATKAGNDITAEFASTMAKLPLNAKGTVSETSAEFNALAPDIKVKVLEAKAAAAAALAGMGAELGGEARAAGNTAVADLGAGLSGARAEAGAAGSEAATAFSDEFKDGAKAAGMAGGVVLGAGITAGVMDNMSVEAGLNKVAVQLGLSQADMKVAGQVAGQVYANNFGEDLPQINEALAGVVKNMNIEIGSADLQPVTEQVLTLVDAFDQDLAMTTAAVGQMIRTGMVKDAQEGLDVLTAGLQSPANKADDLMETMNEYGTQFRNLGLDGKDAMGLLSQGLQGGARDADIVADAMKEFTLLTQGELLKVTQTADGPKHSLTALGEAFRAAGYDALDGNKGFEKAHQLQADLAAGGPKAKKGLDVMLDSLRDTKDPLEQSRNAVAMFGTQAEDMGDALYSLDLSNASDQLGQVAGASEKAVDQMGSGSQATIDSYSRKLIDMGRSAIESTGPTAAVAGAVAAFGPAVLGIAGPVASLLAARSAQAIAAGVAGTAETAATTATTTGWIRAAAASTAGAIKMAASWLIAMGPIALVIAAVVGLVVLIVKNWDTIKEKTAAAWGWVVEKTTGAWDSVVGAVKDKGGAAVEWVRSMPGKAKDALSGAGSALKERGKELLQGIRDGAGDKWEQVKDWFSNAPERAKTAVGNAANALKDKGRDLLQGIRDGAGEKWDAISGWFSNAPERAKTAVGNAASSLMDKGRDLLQGMKDGAVEKWETIKTWFGEVPGKVVNAVGSGLTILSDVGKDIATGMWNGLNSMTEWLKGKVWDWVKSVLPGPVEKALGISSPSKLFRNMMKWVPAGAALGIEDGTPMLTAAVGSMIDSVSGVSVGAATFASVSPNSIPESVEVTRYAADRGTPGLTITNHIYETTNPQATAAETSRRQAHAGVGA